MTFTKPETHLLFTYSHITDLNATRLIESKQQQPNNNSGLRIVSDVVDSSYRVFDGIGKFWQRNTQELENSKAMSGLVNRVRKVSDAAQPMIKEGLSELKEMTITTPSTVASGAKISSDLPSFMESRGNRANSLKNKVFFFFLQVRSSTWNKILNIFHK